MLERLLRILRDLPKAICWSGMLILMMSYAVKATIISYRNDDSFWWHFGELRFYAWDEDFWTSFVLSFGIFFVFILLLLFIWFGSVYYTQRLKKRKELMRRMRLKGHAGTTKEKNESFKDDGDETVSYN
jgi:hypothetical protein